MSQLVSGAAFLAPVISSIAAPPRAPQVAEPALSEASSTCYSKWALGLAAVAGMAAANGSRTARRADRSSNKKANVGLPQQVRAPLKTGPMVVGSTAPVIKKAEDGEEIIMKWELKDQIGAIAPLGLFDPAGLADNEGKFRRFREAELKHGRVAMLATVGFVVQHFYKWPGFEKVPTMIGATDVIPGRWGWYASLVICGILELAVWKQDPKVEPGNFGDPLGLGQYNTDMRNREVSNGRMAMLSAMGILMAGTLTGKDGVDQLLSVKPANLNVPAIEFKLPAVPAMPSLPAVPNLQAPSPTPTPAAQ